MRILHYEREKDPQPFLQKVILEQILLSYLLIYLVLYQKKSPDNTSTASVVLR
jgi:hypothetical protein